MFLWLRNYECNVLYVNGCLRLVKYKDDEGGVDDVRGGGGG